MEDRVLLDDAFRSLSISDQASDGLFTLQMTKGNDVITFELSIFELDDIVKDLKKLQEDIF